MTFVYMAGHKGRAVIADSTDELIKSALLLSQSDEVLNNSAPDPPNWHVRQEIVPFTYIDDSNGCERLNTASGVCTYSKDHKTVSIHAKNCQTYFSQVSERSADLGMKINQSLSLIHI